MLASGASLATKSVRPEKGSERGDRKGGKSESREEREQTAGAVGQPARRKRIQGGANSGSRRATTERTKRIQEGANSGRAIRGRMKRIQARANSGRATRRMDEEDTRNPYLGYQPSW
jgi:hypothetical protein